MSRRFQFSLRALLVIVLIAGSGAWIARWALIPPPLNVNIEVEPFSFVRYDDHAGHLGLAAVVKVTNLSPDTSWYLGYSGAPDQDLRQLVDGNWQEHRSRTRPQPDPGPVWAPLRSMESITIVSGPVSEDAEALRVGLAFTTERLPPTEAHWIFSPAVKIVKRGRDFFAEPQPDKQQEEHVVSLRR